MAYTKTVWVDDSAPPVNAANLNKIEQGIFDVDAGKIDKPAVAGSNGQVLKLVAGVPAWANAGGGELGYQEFTSDVTTTATTEGTATTVVTSPSVTVDGSTPIFVQFFAPVVRNNTAAAIVRLHLFEGSTPLGDIGWAEEPSAGTDGGGPFFVSRRLTPSAGSHTYTVKVFVSAGSGLVRAGAGGTGTFVPGYIRVTSAA